MGAGATGINPICQRWWSQLRVSFWSRAWASENCSIHWSSRRKKDWSVVGSCVRVNWNAMWPRLLANVLRWDERASGGARILVWKQQGVGPGGESQVGYPVSPTPLSPFSCLSTPVPPLPLRLSHPPHPPLASFSRLASNFRLSVFPGLWLVRFPNTARSWHAPSSESVLLDRHGFILCFNDQFPGYMNVGNWHRPGHGHGHRSAGQNAC